jgi:hypothetical protein
MARLSVQIPDELRARAEARAAEAGHSSLDAYLESLLRADLEAPEVEDDDLEQLLLARLDSGPGVEVTPEFVEQFKQNIQRRRQGA